MIAGIVIWALAGVGIVACVVIGVRHALAELREIEVAEQEQVFAHLKDMLRDRWVWNANEVEWR